MYTIVEVMKILKLSSRDKVRSMMIRADFCKKKLMINDSELYKLQKQLLAHEKVPFIITMYGYEILSGKKVNTRWMINESSVYMYLKLNGVEDPGSMIRERLDAVSYKHHDPEKILADIRYEEEKIARSQRKIEQLRALLSD